VNSTLKLKFTDGVKTQREKSSYFSSQYSGKKSATAVWFGSTTEQPVDKKEGKRDWGRVFRVCTRRRRRKKTSDPKLRKLIIPVFQKSGSEGWRGPLWVPLGGKKVRVRRT